MRNFVIRIVGLVMITCAIGHYMYAGSEQWRNFTAMNEARAAVEYDDVVYTITTGGMFSYTNNGERIETFTPSDGLSAIDLRAVAADESGSIWIGAAGGFIDGYNPNDRTWRRVTDITRTDFTQRDITTLVTRGDTLFVGTSYGVSIYSISRNEFNDTYIKFGSFPTQTPVTSIAYDNSNVWIGTARGIARGQVDDPLLAAPDRWTTYTAADTGTGALPHDNIHDIVINNGILFIATPVGAAWYDGDAWSMITGLDGIEIIALEVFDGTVYAATERNIHRISEEGVHSTYGPQLPGTFTNLAHSVNGVIGVTADRGIAILENNSWTTVTPEGPQTNILTDIYVDEQSIVWIATAAGAAGRGFYRYDPAASSDEQWKSYTVQQYSELRANSYYKIFGAGDGTIWVSSHGRGITAVRPDGSLRNYYLDDGLIGIKEDPSYVVVSRAAEDSEGNIWFTMFDTDAEKPLVKLDPESSGITPMTNERNPSALDLRDVIIDRFDTAWIIPDRDGIFYFNEKESIGTNVAGWGSITQSHGLPTNTVNAVSEDNRGEIWIGTGQGLAVIVNPREPQTSIRDIFTLQNQIVTAIEVDPLNRKWIGTFEGIFLLSPDGTQILEHYTVQNTDSKLVSDEVRSIAFDGNTGVVYIGTDRGMSSLQTIAVTPQTAFADLFVAPNPYRIPADHDLKIDGLVRNSSIKILSIDGRLVRTFNSPGGRIAFWDGLDDTGRQVASGVYIVVGVSEDGTEVGKSKVTVIRR